MHGLLYRVGQAAIVLATITFIGFSLFQFVGDPVVNLTGPETTAEERAQLRSQLGLDRPIAIQFANYAVRVVSGDFGTSLIHRRPVLDIIMERIPATLELVFLAMIVALIVAVPAGFYSSVRRKDALSNAILAISIFGVAVPTFLVAIGLVLIFSVWLQWLPSYGRGETRELLGISFGLFTLDGLKHAVMPAAVMCLFQIGVMVRLVRGEMQEVLRSDFIKFCWARGLPAWVVYRSHALRNVLVPFVAVMGVQVSALLTFSIIAERVFQWPGLGQLLLQSIEFGDVPVISAYLLLVGIIIMATNLAVDAACYFLDPRLREA